jgi:hypothetical protein
MQLSSENGIELKLNIIYPNPFSSRTTIYA